LAEALDHGAKDGAAEFPTTIAIGAGVAALAIAALAIFALTRRRKGEAEDRQTDLEMAAEAPDPGFDLASVPTFDSFLEIFTPGATLGGLWE
jgi:hypothetical protein